MLHRHATDVVSLVAGTIFAGVTAVWLLNLGDVIDLEAAWLAIPLVLIVAGVVGLVAAFRPSRPGPNTETAASEQIGEGTQATNVVDDHEPTTVIDENVEQTVVIDDADPTTTLDAPLGGESVGTASAGEEDSRGRTD